MVRRDGFYLSVEEEAAYSELNKFRSPHSHFIIADVQQLVAALLAVFGHHAYHDGIAIGALEHCRVVGLVQPSWQVMTSMGIGTTELYHADLSRGDGTYRVKRAK